MNKITTTQKVCFGACMLLVLSITGYLFLFKHIEEMREKIHEAKTEILNVEKLVQNKQATVVLLNETKKGREELSKYFVPAEDPTPFLELMESSARDSGVVMEVESLTEVESSESEEGLKKIRAVLSVDGGWQNVYHFISLLELMPFAVAVTETAFSIDQKEEGGQWGGLIHLEYRAR